MFSSRHSSDTIFDRLENWEMPTHGKRPSSLGLAALIRASQPLGITMRKRSCVNNRVCTLT
ncbi:hypothetical protein D3C85_1427300 [compost metagenome]